MHDSLREQPYQCNCVIGAVDIPSKTLSIESEQTTLIEASTTSQSSASSSSSSSSSSAAAAAEPEVKGTPHLYYLDYLGTLIEVPYTAQGYCGYLLYGLWDSMWKRDMDVDDGLRMLIASINHVKKRFIVSQSSWIAKIITKDGIKVIDIAAEEERLKGTIHPPTTTTTTTTSSSDSA